MQHRRPLGRRENPFTKGGTRLTFKRDDRNRSLVGRGLIFAFGAIILIMYPWSRPVANSASVETPLKVATVITPNIEDVDLGYKSKLAHDEEEKVPYHTPLADEEDNAIPTKADMNSESIMIEESQDISAENDNNENNALSDSETKSNNFASPMKDEKEDSNLGDDEGQVKVTKTDEIEVDQEDSSDREQEPLNEIEKGENDDSIEVVNSKNFQETQVDPPQEVDNHQETEAQTKSIKDDDESGPIQTIEKNETEAAAFSESYSEHKTGTSYDSSNEHITSFEPSNRDSGQMTDMLDDSNNENITSFEAPNIDSGQKTDIVDDSSNVNITSFEPSNTPKTGVADDLKNENVTSFEASNIDSGQKTDIVDDSSNVNITSFAPSNIDSGQTTGILDDSSDNITSFEASNMYSGQKTDIVDDSVNDNITSFEASNIDSGQKTGILDDSSDNITSFEASNMYSGQKTGILDDSSNDNITSFETSNIDSGQKTDILDDSINDNITSFETSNRDSGQKTGIADELNKENITSFEASNIDSGPRTGLSDYLSKGKIATFQSSNKKTGVSDYLSKGKIATFESSNRDSGPTKNGIADDLSNENITSFEASNIDSGPRTGLSDYLSNGKIATFESAKRKSGHKTGVSDYLNKENETSLESSNKDSGPTKTGASDDLNKENIASFESSKNATSGISKFENRSISKVYMKSKASPKKVEKETKLNGLSINSKINQSSAVASELGNSSKKEPSKKIKNFSKIIRVKSNVSVNVDLRGKKSQFMDSNQTSIKNSEESMLSNVADESNVSISMNNTVEVDSFSIIGARHLNSTRKATVSKKDHISKEKLDFAASHALKNETSIVNETKTMPMDIESHLEVNETEEYTKDRNTSLTLISNQENASILSRSSIVANNTFGNPLLPSNKIEVKITKKSSNTVSSLNGKLRGSLANTTSKRKNT
jgi:hypothetical protein